MDQELSAIIDLVNEAYPDLPILDQLEEWLQGNFQPPLAFIQTQGVTEKGNTLTSYKVMSDAGIILHHPKVNGKYQLISTEPLRSILRRERYSYKGITDGLFINIDSTTFKVKSDKKDRTEITFRFEYSVAIPKPTVEKINEFVVEEEWNSGN